MLLVQRYDWSANALPHQIIPEGNWTTLIFLAGRASGKSRTVCEWLRQRVERGLARRIGIISPTSASSRDIIVKGKSGLLAISPPWDKPEYHPSSRSITWANGAVAQLCNSYEPDAQIRGNNWDTILMDEFTSFEYQQEIYDMAMFCLRSGDNPKCVIATTPKPQRLLKQLVDDPNNVVMRGSTYDNAPNLSPEFINEIIRRYEGTTLGRQEIYGELITDADGALWSAEIIDKHRVTEAPVCDRVVVGVDPSGSGRTEADSCGIVVAGIDDSGHYYVLADKTVNASPDAWAKAAIAAYHAYGADAIVAESNFGGSMVKSVIDLTEPDVNVQLTWSSKSKVIRAEPIAALYEQGKAHHCGLFKSLEDEMTSYVPGGRGKSPNRMDALVFAITALISNRTGTFECDNGDYNQIITR